MVSRIHNLIHNQRGMAVVEFALCAPFLLVLLLGSMEVSRFLLINQKQEKMAFTIADVVAQSTDLTENGLNQLLEATQDMMVPYAFDDHGIVMITSVTKSTGLNPVVNWRYTGGGTLAGQTSVIGEEGDDAELPTGFTLNDGDNVIIAEVFYRFEPVFAPQFYGETVLYKRAIYKPRLGELTDPPA